MSSRFYCITVTGLLIFFTIRWVYVGIINDPELASKSEYSIIQYYSSLYGNGGREFSRIFTEIRVNGGREYGVLGVKREDGKTTWILTNPRHSPFIKTFENFNKIRLSSSEYDYISKKLPLNAETNIFLKNSIVDE